jgi:hypothetical protein
LHKSGKCRVGAPARDALHSSADSITAGVGKRDLTAEVRAPAADARAVILGADAAR